MAVSYGIIGGLVLFGTAGYLLDMCLRMSPWLLILGLATGVAVGSLSRGGHECSLESNTSARFRLAHRLLRPESQVDAIMCARAGRPESTTGRSLLR